MLVDHTKVKVAIKSYYEFRKSHKACPPDTLMT